MADVTEEAWWNGDVHIAKLTGEMALKLRDSGHGHPEHVTPDEWRDLLTKIGEPLAAYAAAGTSHTRDQVIGARVAFHLFADWFDHFWD